MKARFSRSVLLLCIAGLVACSSVLKTGEKLDPNAERIRDLTIAIRMADLSNAPNIFPEERVVYRTQFKAALESRFPEIFRVNGVPVASTFVQDGRTAFIPNQFLNSSSTSHVLVLNAKSVSYLARFNMRNSDWCWVRYEAELWDMRHKRVVWKATPQHSLEAKNPQPLRKTQAMAGWLLNAMNSDSLIAMKQKEAKDLSGKTITTIYNWDVEDY